MSPSTATSMDESRPGAAAWARSLLPSLSDYSEVPRTWKRDLVAGVTVGVVALPLALAFGVSTGLGAASGVVTAIVAGVVAAVFGGSHVQVSGPTGAMTVVLVPVVHRFGPQAVLVVSILAGAMVILGGVAGIGRYLAYLPWPVVEGFTVGIAVIIFLQQVPAALGVAKPDGENTGVVAARALIEALRGNARGIGPLVLVAVVVAVMVVAPRVHRSLPASLIAVVVATLVARVVGFDVALIGRLPSSLPAPSLPSVDWAQLSDLFSAAFAVAVLAALESLLSAQVADGMMDREPHNPDRELVGQGLANLISPLFGGMPATGAIARTAVNVRSGAQTRLAAIVHAAVLFGVVSFVGGVVGTIPLAALAGILMMTAIRMVERHAVRSVVTSTRSDAVVFALTAVATVAFDLIAAVEIGVAAAALLVLRGVARSSGVTLDEPPVLPPVFRRPASMEAATVETVTGAEADALRASRIVTYRLDGALFFGAARRFLSELTAVSDVSVVVLRLPGLAFIDATGARTLGEIVDELERRRITVLVKGPRPEHLKVLAAVGVLDQLAARGHLFDSLEAALAHARRHADRDDEHAHADPDGGAPVDGTADGAETRPAMR